MFAQVKSILRLMGNGLASQDLGEMYPTASKIVEMEKRSQNYRLSGGQSRIVLIASTDPLGSAFDFVVKLSKQTRSLIEVLYIRPVDGENSTLSSLLGRLGELACDFQITFLTGNLLEVISDYNSQRQDVLALICSASEVFTEELRSAQQIVDPTMSISHPRILFVGDSMMA